MTPMLRDLQRARLRQIEYLTRYRSAHRRRRRQRRPAAPAGLPRTCSSNRSGTMMAVRHSVLPLKPRSVRPSLRPVLPLRLPVRRSDAGFFNPSLDGGWPLLRLYQTETTLQFPYPLPKPRGLLPKRGVRVLHEAARSPTQDARSSSGSLGPGHPQWVKRLGTTHPKVDSFFVPTVNPINKSDILRAVTTSHDKT